MVYTEIKSKNGKKYYYRVRSIRIGKKFKKQRIYLGVDLPNPILSQKEEEADKKLREHKINKILSEIKPKILEVLKKYNIKKAGIFGSYARGEQKKKSDIDIIVEPPKGIGFGFAGIAIELEEALDKKVDLITYNYIDPYIKKDVLKEEVRII
jgi:predicted nucleotidyltransferase